MASPGFPKPAAAPNVPARLDVALLAHVQVRLADRVAAMPVAPTGKTVAETHAVEYLGERWLRWVLRSGTNSFAAQIWLYARIYAPTAFREIALELAP